MKEPMKFMEFTVESTVEFTLAKSTPHSGSLFLEIASRTTGGIRQAPKVGGLKRYESVHIMSLKIVLEPLFGCSPRLESLHEADWQSHHWTSDFL